MHMKKKNYPIHGNGNAYDAYDAYDGIMPRRGGGGGGRGGIPLYGLYRYMRPQRVWLFSRFGLK